MPLLRSSRSYGGTDCNSDHKLALLMNNFHLVYKHGKKRTGQPRINVEQLRSDDSTREAYREQLQTAILKQAYTNDPKTALVAF